MKNSTHYRLRALACALLASAAMLGACDDDDPNDDPDPGKKPPVTLTDQIQYDGGDLVGIKSAIYVAEEDGSHTFYLSPTEGLINAEQMKQADDYLRVMVESPKGTVNTASDPFEIEYKDISVKKTTMNDVASVELSADLVTKTRLNLYTYVELKSGYVSHVVSNTHDTDVAALDDTDCGALPCGNFFLNVFLRPVADNDFSWDSHTCHDMSVLAVAVSGLIQVHEVHVDGVIWNLHVVLCM